MNWLATFFDAYGIRETRHAASLQALFTTTETTQTTGKRQHGVSLELVVSLGGRAKKRKTHVAFFMLSVLSALSFKKKKGKTRRAFSLLYGLSLLLLWGET